MREILIYKAIGSGEKQFQAESFVQGISAVDASSDLTIRFNSPGGSVFDGFAIISKMEESAVRTHGIVDGIAASMAAFIALRCDRLTMNRNAKLMLHLPQTSVSGDSTRLREMAVQLDQLKDRFALIIAERAGISTDEAERLYLQPGKDVWLSSQEALNANLIDEIVGTEQQLPVVATADEWHQIYAHIIEITKNEEMNKEKLIGLLGAQANAEMTDDEIFALVEGMFSEFAETKAEIQKLKADIKAFEDAKLAEASAEINTLLTAAIEEKRISADQRPKWETMFQANHEVTKDLLASIVPPITVKQFVKAPMEKTEAELVVEYREADRKGKLAEIKAADPERFKAMYKATFRTDYKEN